MKKTKLGDHLVDTNEETKREMTDFKIGKLIGKGSYANVKIAKDMIINKRVAMKIYKK
jgi:serine/threonine protein kinase